MNHMKDVAQLLGVELNEEFIIKSTKTGLGEYKFRITEKYFEYFNEKLDGWFISSSITLCNLLNGEYKVVKIPKPVLDDVEKEYLSAVIKPFRHRIKYFYKYSCVNDEYEAIAAIMETYGYFDYLAFPKFKKGSMYKGMGLMREYTLDDLGL